MKSKIQNEVIYTPLYQRFLKKDVHFTTQYSHIYLARLTSLKPCIVARINSENIRDFKVVDKVIDLKANDCGIIIGTLFKQQDLKPDVLDEFTNEFNDLVEYKAKNKNARNYCSHKDYLILEDESGRVKLIGVHQDNVDGIVTGVVVGVRGRMSPNGDFHVDIASSSGRNPFIFPEIATQNSIDVSSISNNEAKRQKKPKKLVALISNLRIGVPGNDVIKLTMLEQYLAQHNGNSGNDSEVIRLIIVGNSVHDNVHNNSSIEKQMKNEKSGCIVSSSSMELEAEEKLLNEDIMMDIDYTADKFSQVKQRQLVENLVMFDKFLCGLVDARIEVDVMPGREDLMTTGTLPQQPFSSVMFDFILAKTRIQNDNPVKMVTNPYEFQLTINSNTKKSLFLGMGGQILEDISKYSIGYSPKVRMNTQSTSQGSSDSDKLGLKGVIPTQDREKIAAIDGESPSQKSYTRSESDQLSSEEYFGIMENQLFNWRHIAPTCPDSLPTYPLDGTRQDPFIVEDNHLPNIFFSATQIHESETQKYSKLIEREGRKVRMILVPDFSLTGDIILVDVSSPIYETTTISFHL